MRKHFILFLLAVFLTACNGNIENNITEEQPQIQYPQDTEEQPQHPQDTEEQPQHPQEIEELKQLQYPQIFTTTVDRIDFVVFSEGIYCIFNGVKYGFMNENGEEITSFIYDFAYPFSEGLACVSRDGKYGFIDQYGNEALPFIYDKANSFVEGLAYFEIGDKYGFIDQSGNEVFLLDCDSISSFREGLAYFSIDGRYGYIDKTGKKVIEPVYDDVGYFRDGLAIIRSDGCFGIIDKEENEIVSAKYDKVEIINRFIKVKLNYKYGCYDNNGNRILPCEYDNVVIYEKGIIFCSNGKCGLADENGNIIIEPSYDYLSIKLESNPITGLKDSNLVEIKVDEHYGIIDFEGNIKVPVKYGSIGYISDGMLAVQINSKWGFLNISDFSESIPPIYDHVWVFIDGRVVVVLNNKYGVIDKNGDILIPFDYDDIRIFENGAHLLIKDGKSSLIDRNGNTVSERQYDRISRFYDCYKVEISGRYGFINDNGEEIIPPEYNYLYKDVYRSYNHYVTYDYSSPDKPQSIIKMGDNKQVDLSELLLKNEITPRIKLFNQFLINGSYTNSNYGDGNKNILLMNDTYGYVKTVKLYDIDGSGNPILYFYAEPVIIRPFPLSYSGFYAIKNNQVNQLFSGYECGGSARGDYVCLWKDKQSSKIMLGSHGSSGFSEHSSIYEYRNGEAKKSTSFTRIRETADDLEFWINDKQSSVEEYDKINERFKKIYLGY